MDQSERLQSIAERAGGIRQRLKKSKTAPRVRRKRDNNAVFDAWLAREYEKQAEEERRNDGDHT